MGVEAPQPVQELVSGNRAAAGDVPTRFFARAHDEALAMAAAPVSVIDLSHLCRPDSADEAAKLRLALESWGLFLVANHGIEASLMDGMMDASREFFRQPPEVKQKHTNLVLVDGKHFQLEGYGNDRVEIIYRCSSNGNSVP